MKTKTTSRQVEQKQISYKRMAELLLELHVEFQLLADTKPEDDNCISATTITSPESFMFFCENNEFDLSLDLNQKGGLR